MGVKLFLHELYPSPITGDKQSISKQSQKKKIKSKTIHSQMTHHMIILPTHIGNKINAGSAYTKRPTPPSVINKNDYRSSRGILQASSVAETSRMVNFQMDQEHSVKLPVEANFVAPEQLGDSTQKLPEQSPKNAAMQPVTKETSIATPSVDHPLSSSVGSNVDASEISGDSTQKLPGQSPKNAKRATATSETSIATPSAAPSSFSINRSKCQCI